MVTESRELFDRHAGHYNHPIPAHVQEHYLAKRLNFFKSLQSSGRVLDAGCGTARFLEQAAQEGFFAFGIDESLEMLRQEKRTAGRLIQGDLARLPYSDQAFDLVVSIAVFHHIGDAARVALALAEMARITKPGGHVVVWDHNLLNPYWKIFMRKLPWDDHVHRIIPAQEIVGGLRRAGLRDVFVRYSGLIPDFARQDHMPLWRALEKIIEGTPLLRRICAHNVVVGLKA